MNNRVNVETAVVRNGCPLPYLVCAFGLLEAVAKSPQRVTPAARRKAVTRKPAKALQIAYA